MSSTRRGLEARLGIRIVDADGKPVTSLYGRKLLGGAIVLGSGNPGDEGKSYGVSFEVTKVASGNSYATVHVTSARS
jgi:immune inhibitor A